LCGSKYIDGKQQPWQCSGCGNKSFTNSPPTVEIAFFDTAGRILLAERGIEPNVGKFDLPGGFVDYGETIEQALAREIQEELGLTRDQYTEPVFVLSWVGESYKFSKESVSPLNSVFVSKLLTDDVDALDDVASIKFVDLSEIGDVDFSYHQYPENIRKAHRQLFG